MRITADNSNSPPDLDRARYCIFYVNAYMGTAKGILAKNGLLQESKPNPNWSKNPWNTSDKDSSNQFQKPKAFSELPRIQGM
jgi:hypothetical protein